MADALSRVSLDSSQRLTHVCSTLARRVPCLQDLPAPLSCLQQDQRTDPNLSTVIKRLLGGENIDGYVLVKDLLYVRQEPKGRLVLALPDRLFLLVFKFFHEPGFGGHLGYFKTRHKIAQFFGWRHMARDIRKAIRACPSCAIAKSAPDNLLANAWQLSALLPTSPQLRISAVHGMLHLGT